MPPPELLERAAPASVGTLVLEHLRAEAPMARHNGPRAAEAHLRGQLIEARAAGNTAGEREAAVALARHLAARGRDLGVATKLARRALVLGDDPMLRVELAGWLAGLGDTGGAAGVLRALVSPERPAEAARTTVKIAVLLARAGDASAAAEALDEAASTDPGDAMAVELFGTLSSWAPETVTPDGAASAYLEASRRRGEAGDVEAAYEDKLRAFEVAPHHPGAAEAVATALTARGMAAAAAEVRRLHAVALGALAAMEAGPSRVDALLEVGELAGLTDDTSDRETAAIIERVMTTVLPRGVWCGRLARSFDRLGEPELAFAWTQRWLALHPGSAEAMRELLRRAAATGHAARLADALGWVLAQPRPLADLAEAVGLAVTALFDLERARGRALARRALDVLGPGVPALRERLLSLAERAADPGLAISVLERWLATGTLGAEGSTVLLDLARRRTSAGDYDGAARELARAAEARGDPGAVLQLVGDLEGSMREAGAWLGSDGLVAAAEAKALALAALGPDTAGAAAVAYRELGSLRWDLGEDPRSAEEAFFRASEITPAGGVERYARDLTTFGGVHEAIEALLSRAERAALSDRAGPPSTKSPPSGIGGPSATAARKVRGSLLFEAARLATEHGLPERALEAAAGAIESDPTRADAIPWVEKNAHVEGGIAVLDHAYDLLAGAALGCFGRRAAHHRAARQLERRGVVDLALKHAAACFEALPSEGTSYVLLTRLAERSGDPTEAVRALTRVAEAASAAARPTWLKRAASLAGPTEEGVRTRFDLLLRALNARPDPDTVAEVAAAVRDLSRIDGGGAAGSADMVRLRSERALGASLRRLDGPDGARAAVAMAALALELGARELAFTALDRAAEADGDVDEYGQLEPKVAELAAERGAAEAWVLRLRAAADKPYSSVGGALLRLGSLVARALGDTGARAALLLTALRRVAQDEGQLSPGLDFDALVEQTDLAVHDHGDPELAQKLDAIVSPADRAQSALRLAEERERRGDEGEAILALERAIAEPALDAETKARASGRLQHLLGLTGRDTDAEALLRAELARGSLPPAAHGKVAHHLADFLLRRDKKEAAFDVLAGLAAEGGPPDPDLLAEMRGLARATDVLGRYAEVLAGAVGRAEGPAARLEILRELAPIYGELGEAERAAASYEQIAALDPADLQALEILERAADERGDHPAIADLLGRRIGLTGTGDKKRMLRLRRAAVLEQRLGLLDDAATELGALLVESPDDQSAMRFLADVQERRGAPLAAAALLVRLEDLANNVDEKADYGLRAATAYLAGADLDAAEEILERIAPIAPREGLLSLRVELSRTTGDARALGEALEQLAAASGEPPERRAALLLEAARASAALGDDAAALDRARRALKLAPNLAEAVLEARRLTYRSGGAGTPREAQAAVDDLARVESRLEGSQIELHAFLLAEELDVIQGGGAGMRELSRRHAEVGPLPLIALGMAERLVRAKNFDAALPLFTQALAGDLRGLRSRGRVALAAAEAAAATTSYKVAAELLDLAAGEPETQILAQRKQLELAATIGDPAIARQALEELLRQTTGLDRARVLLQLGKILAEVDPDEAARLLAEAAPLAGGDRVLPSQIADVTLRIELARAAAAHPDARAPALEAAVEAPVAAPPEAGAPPSEAPEELAPPVPSDPEPAPVSLSELQFDVFSDAPASLPPLEGEPSSSGVPAEPLFPTLDATTEPVAPPRLSLPTAPAEAAPPARPPPLPSPVPPPRSPLPPPLRAAVTAPPGTEDRLAQELSGGSFEAGEQLVSLYGARAAERAPELLAVRRQQAAIRLGDRAALQRLIEAAVLDGHPAYARAVEHVLHVWDPGGPPPPPPLASQRVAPELLAALLFRTVADSAVHEALALVLDTGLYRRDVGQYQLTGVARVQPTGGTVLGEVFGVAARLLGQQRTVLFHHRAGGAPSFKVALLSPPAVVLSGDVREETPELRYLLGAALAGAMPEHALVNALGEEGLRTLVEALHAAFGPVANLPRGNAAVARLGQNLWQLVPPRADRRLRELCADLAQIAPEAAMDGTRQAMRRSGLFTSGHLGTALAQLGAELGISFADYQGTPDGLTRACAAHPEVADLVRLAIRTELAEARWSPASAQDRRRIEGGPRSQRWDAK